ncbi:MAG: peptide deformylase [Limosilactobacillus sp.]|uniref:peptide deformylase n=1 Tax=Limosilactobacillus sp. TaxID=2773925 RepID=UPI0027036463|nr:peptide deformylase [Limosilactobacillus sp.]
MIKQIVKDTTFLQQRSTPASKADLQVGADLQDTLMANRDHCVGMAANMIGIKKRVIIAMIGPFPVLMFNPVITKKSGKYETEEGCLSLTGERPTTRYEKITVKFRDKDWKEQELPLEAFPAQIVQHEIDHCDGILI